ncbi:MAG TPA: hypothetical protein VK498_13455 [Ferruginibacter sp.]|nr:hypothetical protein [Ferruginibacter sp.]
MSNRIKKFIWDNRKDFDDAVPPINIWENIEAAMGGKKQKRSILRPLIKWTMSAAAILMIGIGIYFMLDKKDATLSSETVFEPADIDGLAPEMKQFAKMINLKQDELKKMAKDQPELYQRFAKDISQLDSSYNILKDQLSETPNKEMLLEAMIQNLQLQLNVLNQQLNIIHQIKQSKKYSHEKIDQTI